MTSPTAQSRIVQARVLDTPLDVEAISASVSDAAAGATVTFLGVVRNHDGGEAVTEIEYVGHPSADQVIAEVTAEFTGREGVHAIAAVHRVGTLVVGDTALVVAVSASHRAEAFGTASDLVDRIKEKLPVWKRQLFTDGRTEWTGCP